MSRYGASPVHLLAHAVLLPLAGWALLQLVDVRAAGNVLAWFVGALILHDMIALPLYSTLDRLAQRARLGGIAVINHLRVPALLSVLTFAVYFPLITAGSHDALRSVSGVDPEGYLERWLVFVAAVWAVSAAALALRIQQLPDARAAAADDDAPGA